ncbi:tetratricopeptide repeat protein [Actinoplanes sp. NPDC051494]|uniref:AfsR/SARP family transcriptional regulator n=1 Tax=Actinoplanes sp. NPDC051494 TaxID=3363907 RepID=UPI0037B89B0E
MDLILLGPVALSSGAASVDLGPPKQRALLATLALQAGQTVGVPVLVDRIWEERPPAEARKVLHSYITRVRRTVALAGAGIARGPGGYRLDVDPEAVDAHRFEGLVRRAAVASGPGRAELLSAALGLWRGDPLGGVPGAWAEKVREGFRQRRLEAATDWADIRLAAGEPRAVIVLLEALLQEYPLAEPVAARLMRALGDSGRKAEALDLFARVRRRIADELGVEPGPDLHAGHRSLLSADLPAEPVVGRGGPAQLPPDVRGFVDRTAELAALDEIFAGTGREPHALTIAAVSGTAGVGKTALTIRWANRVAGRFPDGQLYVDLRGYDPERPMSPETALSGFLHALGVAGGDIPLSTADRAAQFRTLVAGRRMLLLLDNASSAEQVRQLLPGVASVFVLVTSRDSLPGLVARHGATRIELELLDLPDSLALLRALVNGRVDEDPAAAEALVTLCARLPLAVRIAAELVLAQPRKPLRDLVAELTGQGERLARLEAGQDSRTAVTAVFSWSYSRLPAPAALVFRGLGSHFGPVVDERVAAALAGVDVPVAREALEVLARAHLVRPTEPGRYVMHDLLRAYSAGLTSQELTAAARERLVAYYVARVGEGTEVADDHAERLSLVAASAHAAEHGPYQAAIDLADGLWRHLDASGHQADATVLHAHARAAARNAGDPGAESRTLISLGVVAWRRNDYVAATALFGEALRLARQAGDELTEARALTNLGLCTAAQGRYTAAAGHLEPALRTFVAAGHDRGAAGTYINLALIYLRQGRLDEAADGFERAVELSERLDDQVAVACTLTNLGMLATMRGRLPEAFELLDRGLELSLATGYRRNEAHTLTNLGTARLREGALPASVELHERALALFQEIEDAEGEANALVNLGEALVATGDLTRAREVLMLAVGTAAGHDAGWEEAAGLVELGKLYRIAGDLDAAHARWRRALTLYVEFGTPQADEVRALLNAGACASVT